MHTTHRAALQLAAALAVLPLLAAAQPAPAASAASAQKVYTEADISRNTACGAYGVGRIWSGPRRGDIEPRERPGTRVSAEGWWSNCTMPPPPKDCPDRRVADWRGDGGWRLCKAAGSSMLRARNVGREWEVTTAAGAPTWGSQRWRCERLPDGSADWKLVKSHCAGR